MEELVIPLKLDTSEARRSLRALVDQAGEAGSGLDKAKQSGDLLTHTVANLISNQGVQMLREGAQILTQGFEQAAKHVKEVAQEFLKLQESLRIIATFKGEQLTDESTVESAKAGAAAGLTPQQWRAFEEQFFGFSGQFIGDDVDAQGNRTRKFTSEQGKEMEQRAAAFMNARGIQASQGGAIFGELLQQAKPGDTTDDIMTKFGQAYSILEQAKGDPGTLMAQMGQVTAQGVDVGTGAKIMRAMAQRDPGDAGTYSRALLRGFTTMKDDDAREMGITGDMDVFQKVEAVQSAMDKAGIAPGSDAENKFLKKRFQDEREFGAISAAINFGSRGGLFKAADEDAAKFKPGGDEEAVAEFRASAAGRRIFSRADAAAAKIEEGARFADVEDLKVQAEAQLEREHAFTEPGIGGVIGRGILSKSTGVSPEQQMINERAIELAREQAGETGSKFLTGDVGLGQAEANQEILRLLRIANEQRDRQERKPLVAQPPQAGGARP